jgi:hypothetical protein
MSGIEMGGVAARAEKFRAWLKDERVEKMISDEGSRRGRNFSDARIVDENLFKKTGGDPSKVTKEMVEEEYNSL